MSEDAIHNSIININYTTESSILELNSKLLKKLGLAHKAQDIGQEELNGFFVMRVLGLTK